MNRRKTYSPIVSRCALTFIARMFANMDARHMSNWLAPGLGLGLLAVLGALFAQAPARPPEQAGRGWQPPAVRIRYRTKITIYDLKAKNNKVVFTDNQYWQSPNWTPDGKYLVANMDGGVYRIPIKGDKTGTPEKINFSIDLLSSNDHALSPDGKQIALTTDSPAATGHGPDTTGSGRLFISSIDGSNARELVRGWMHGWSPDGMYLVYTSRGISRIRPDGRDATQLTASSGDGADYSPDGKWIYFCSNRSGNYDIWRIPKDGGGPNDSLAQQITKDNLQDYFPHPSPDGRWLYFESYPAAIRQHGWVGEGMRIRMIPLPDDQPGTPPIQTVATFYGGQGTANTGGWSPDSRRFVYAVYEKLPGQPEAK